MSFAQEPNDPSAGSSRPASPPTPAEIRSLAVAKLKRAASLPRNPDGRRPSQTSDQRPIIEPPSLGPILTTGTASQPVAQHFDLHDNGDTYGDEEVLSPSPIHERFDHNTLLPMPMQRSASAGSDYHIPTPTRVAYGPSGGTPFYSPAEGPSERTSMQVTQSYLPSLPPAGVSPSPFGHPASGRNTPSPLPTLGELRTLQRSNSNAARAHAMSKLTGGRDTPSASDDEALQPGRPLLHRADTMGARRAYAPPNTREGLLLNAVPMTATPEMADTRPRLQRSFTVSSSNMGEERRSAVGRRMVERLGQRDANRDKEQAEVRQMWEERRAAAESAGGSHADTETPRLQAVQESTTPAVPTLARTLPVNLAAPQRSNTNVTFGSTDALMVPERPASRDTMRSNGEAFEYEAHLRRSLSSRTARGAVGTVEKAAADNASDIPEVEQLQMQQVHQNSSGSQRLDPIDTDLRPRVVAPAKRSPRSSVHDVQSPNGSSFRSGDALGSMMFVLGGNSASASQPRSEHYPSGVEEHGGSEWGTPARDHQATFTDSPLISMSTHMQSQPASHLSSTYVSEDEEQEPTPPGSSTRESFMSWEKVGGPQDLEVPSDPKYHKNSGSLSAKIGRSVKTAMRKRSQSKSSVTSSNLSPPTSPRGLSDIVTSAVQTFSRRASESSLSPSQASIARSFTKNSPISPHGERLPSHQPSISSLSPSLTRSDSVTNSSLLQHEAPQREWLPRRADPDDPRIQSTKMSPFPGIADLETRGRGEANLAGPPKLVQMLSDSAVPTQQYVTAPEAIYALPLPSTSDATAKRGSADSQSKRSWLSKALGQATSPRSSGSSMSRKNSIASESPDVDDKRHHRLPSVAHHPTFAEPDPFAGPPLGATKGLALNRERLRAASPSVSIVPEGSEEGSRLTRFTMGTTRLDTKTPVLEERDDSGRTETLDGPVKERLPQKSKEVLRRMDDLLAMGPDDPARPDILDDPPRKLLLSTQILQVVNVHTAKDRFLFLFNDILVITKPLITHGVLANLDMRFIVKSVVPLDQIHISGFEVEPTTEPERHHVVNRFIEQFAADPLSACRYLVDRSNPKVDAVTLASLIFKTPELNKTQIGHLLAGNEVLAQAFIDRFHFKSVQIDDALRMFLLSLRLPTDPTLCENMLRLFAYRYYEANQEIISYDRDLAADLVLATIQLNDALFGTFGFALPNHAITKDIFISAFRSKDPHVLVPDELLAAIYSSIRRNRLVQALATHEAHQAKEVTVTPNRLPPKLTYNVWSDRVYISIPNPDPSFKIKLHGEGLEFDPPLLDFSNSMEESFRVRGLTLGTKSVLFDRVGGNAAYYASLGNTRTFTVERALMRHTFHVSFLSHTGLKRKYCFSVADAETRAKWGRLLEKQVALACHIKAESEHKPQTTSEAIRTAAESVSLQVLRDALIPPEEKPNPTTSIPPPTPMGSLNPGPFSFAANASTLTAANARKPHPRTRAGSVSKTYAHMAGAGETALGPLQPSKVAHKGEGEKEKEKTSGLMELQTGKELVLLCRQNSLLPGLLELLQVGKEAVGHGVSDMMNGHGHGNGEGPGHGYQEGGGYGHEYGQGYDHGHGNGYGQGQGHGYGNGNGNGLENEHDIGYGRGDTGERHQEGGGDHHDHHYEYEHEHEHTHGHYQSHERQRSGAGRMLLNEQGQERMGMAGNGTELVRQESKRMIELGRRI